MPLRRMVTRPRLGWSGSWVVVLCLAGCAPAAVAPAREGQLSAAREPERMPAPAAVPAFHMATVARPEPATPPSLEPASIAGGSAPKPPIAPPLPRSSPLPSGFYNPMPGGVFAGYRADTGLD